MNPVALLNLLQAYFDNPIGEMRSNFTSAIDYYGIYDDLNQGKSSVKVKAPSYSNTVEDTLIGLIDSKKQSIRRHRQTYQALASLPPNHLATLTMHFHPCRDSQGERCHPSEPALADALEAFGQALHTLTRPQPTPLVKPEYVPPKPTKPKIQAPSKIAKQKLIKEAAHYIAQLEKEDHD